MAGFIDKFMNDLAQRAARINQTKALTVDRGGELADHHIPDPTVYGNQSDLYRRLAWVQIAVNHVAAACASQALQVYRLNGENKEPIINHEFERLLHNPNELQTGFEFMVMSFSYKLLTGNSYWWKNIPINNGKPIELIPISPAHIKPVPGAQLGTLKGYVYTAADGSEVAISPDEIVHYKNFNPASVYVGLSPIESFYMDAKADLGMQQVNEVQYGENGGRIPSILVFKDPINETDWTRIKKDIQTQSKKREMLLLRGVGDGVNLLQNAISKSDMQFIESRNFTKEEIYSIYAPGLANVLAINATEANAKTGENTFTGKAVYPHLRAMAERITKNILPAYGENLVAEFDDPRIPDTEMELKEIAIYQQSHTIDEVRKKFYSDGPLPEVGGMLLSMITAPQNTQNNAPDVQLSIDEKAETPPEREQAVNRQKAMIDDLKRWQRKAEKRVKRGADAQCSFESEYIPEGVREMVEIGLEAADCPDCVAEVFDDVIHFSQKGDLPERHKKFVPKGADVPYLGDDKPITEEDISAAISRWDKAMPDYRGMLDAKVSE